MRSRTLLPVVAAVVAALHTVTRWTVPLVVSSSADIPSPQTLSLYTSGSRVFGFLLVYGLLFAVAYQIGGGGRPDGDGSTGVGDLGRTALFSGLAAGVATLVGGVVVVFVVGGGSLLRQVLTVVFSGIDSGVQFAVVTFAGLALARLRSEERAESGTRRVRSDHP